MKKTTMIEDTTQIIAVYHSRKKFYNGRDIYWYEFLFDDGTNLKCDSIGIGYNNRFLRVPTTKYYEFGGNHDDAIKILEKNGFSVIEGNEL